MLTFVLSGMSKIAGLPQMKVGWIAALGPDGDRGGGAGAAGGDCGYVSVDECAGAVGAAGVAGGAEGIQEQILERVRGNLAVG